MLLKFSLGAILGRSFGEQSVQTSHENFSNWKDDSFAKYSERVMSNSSTIIYQLCRLHQIHLACKLQHHIELLS